MSSPQRDEQEKRGRAENEEGGDIVSGARSGRTKKGFLH